MTTSWTPPSLGSLSFSSNCTLVYDFLDSWFDVSSHPNLADYDGSKRNVTFWIQPSIKADRIYDYFRNALPPNVRDAASYGDILQWELDSRAKYSATISEALSRNVALPTAEIPYLYNIIVQPARICQIRTQTICRLSINPQPLAGINGPGVSTYRVQAVRGSAR